MPDAGVPPAALAIIEGIAGAVRRELGEEADAYPGLRSPDAADPLNRAFRSIVHWILTEHIAASVDLPAHVSRALRPAAGRRLSAEGWDDRQVRSLVDLEPGSPDD